MENPQVRARSYRTEKSPNKTSKISRKLISFCTLEMRRFHKETPGRWQSQDCQGTNLVYFMPGVKWRDGGSESPMPSLGRIHISCPALVTFKLASLTWAESWGAPWPTVGERRDGSPSLGWVTTPVYSSVAASTWKNNPVFPVQQMFLDIWQHTLPRACMQNEMKVPRSVMANIFRRSWWIWLHVGT